MRKEIRKLISCLAIIQVFILVGAICANSHLLGEIFSVDEIGLIDAQEIQEEEGWNCCTKTNEGAICQELGENFVDECEGDLIPTSCDSVSDCKLGCCIDEVEGLCAPRTPQKQCVEHGGKWMSDESCLVAECQRKCCVLGSEVQFVTPARCEKLSLLHGFEMDLRDLKSELECLALAESYAEGACLIGEDCRFTTEIDCSKMQGEFYEDILCSYEGFNNSCSSQNYTSCVEGKDEVYWFDSCGNRENIYSSDKDASYNNGEVLSKAESCGTGGNNAGSKNCGNCNRLIGSRCIETEEGAGVKDGNNICGNLNCVDQEGRARQNGESWCVYDSFIGEGKDTVGSRHWKRMCVEGEIIVEPCADYRGQVCVESRLNNSDGGELSIANCVINEAVKCLGLDPAECEEKSQCMVKEIDVDEGFQFDVCVGKYPRGFDLKGESGSKSLSGEVCASANTECTVIYEKGFGGWECIYNCNCETDEFSEQMNDFCIALGDCGSYINYIGDGTDNIEVDGADDVSWQDYVEYAEPVKGQYVEPNTLEEIWETFGNAGITPYDATEGEGLRATIDMLGTIIGGAGMLVKGAAFMGLISLETATVPTLMEWAAVDSAGSVFVPEMTATAWGAFSAYASGISIGIMLGGFIADALGLQGTGSMIMMAGGAIAGIGGAMAYLQGALFGTGGLIMGIGIAIMAIVAIMGIGKTKEVIVEFECLPWQAPVGGDNCELCNEEPLKPCSEYRCSSLGQACELLNEDSENPICIAQEENISGPPMISPGSVSEDYKFQDISEGVEIKQANGKCIPEFTYVNFSLLTDKYAQCRFSYDSPGNFNSMSEYFMEMNYFTLDHTGMLMMPSLESLEVASTKETGNLSERFGEMELYVKCIDNYGLESSDYKVSFCVNNGPDITAPRITRVSPKSGSFVKINESSKSVVFYVNEPADCRWDENPGVSFGSMNNEMNCDKRLDDYGIFGWSCKTSLSGFNKIENNFYIKCKDQPWLPMNNETRNANSEDYVYILKKVNKTLKIDSIEPSGDIERGFHPISIDLEVKTSEGAEDGKAICYYSFTGNKSIQFFDTGSSYHSQNFNTIMSGRHRIFVTCKDAADNIVRNWTEFELSVDSVAPRVVRAYNENNQLIIQTDEDAECYYDFQSCNFNFENASDMTTAYDLEHSADWIIGKTYYIKCQDVWGNFNSDCAIKVKTN